MRMRQGHGRSLHAEVALRLAIGMAVVLAAAVALFEVTAGAGWIVLGLAFVGGVIAFLNARDQEFLGRDGLSATAPRLVEADRPSIDLGDELADLLTSARQRAGRMLEDRGRLDPFVIYEDAQGSVRIRPVDAPDPDMALARAREGARSIDESAPRVVLVVPGAARIGGRTRRVVVYEAAERRFRDRTLTFIQPYVPRRARIFAAHAEGLPIYVGDGTHALRFSSRAAAGSTAEPST
jgi:hypothetical protein